MTNFKNKIIEKICFTELVYGRINKKLGLTFSNEDIERLIKAIIRETDESNYSKLGKNIYIFTPERNIRLTINSSTFRIITADILNKSNKIEPPPTVL